MKKIFGIVFLVTQITINAQESQFEIIFSQNFEHHQAPVEYTTDLWNPDWNYPGYRDGDYRAPSWFAENIKDSIVSDPETGSKVMKFNFKDTIVDGYSGVSPKRGGDYWKVGLDGESKELYLSYNVRFRPGWEWNEGGKLPATNGGSPLDKITQDECIRPGEGEGYSSAIMWKDYGGLAFYLFYQDQPNDRWGQTIFWDDFQPDGLDYDAEGRFIFNTEERSWYNITIRVVVNSFTNGEPNKDGIMEGFIDGKLVESVTGLYLLTKEDIDKGVNEIALGHFFGGNENYQGPLRDEWSYLDDFVCFTYADQMDVVKGNVPSPEGRILSLPYMKIEAEEPVDPPVTVDPPAPVDPPAEPEDSTDISDPVVPSDSVVVEDPPVNIGDPGVPVDSTEIAEPEEAIDQEAPTVPDELNKIIIDDYTIKLYWTESTDNVGVSCYYVYLNSVLIDSSIENSILINQLTPETLFDISVSARDEAGNESPRSSPLQFSIDPISQTDFYKAPELSVLKVTSTMNAAQTLSRINSFGQFPFQDYGIVVYRLFDSPQNGTLLYASEESTTLYSGERVEDGLAAFYNFSEIEGSLIRDRSGAIEPLDLFIKDPEEVTVSRGHGVYSKGNTIVSSIGDHSMSVGGIRLNEEFTLEAWIKPSKLVQDVSSRILALSSDAIQEEITLDQTGDGKYYQLEITTSSVTQGEKVAPFKVSSGQLGDLSLHHVVYTISKSGLETIYIDGMISYSGQRNVPFSGGRQKLQMAIANGLAEDTPWEGTYYLLAVYDRALDPGEIGQNYMAGPGNVDYKSDLSGLIPNTEYIIAPFAQTTRGLIYGSEAKFQTSNTLIPSDKDSLKLIVYPNPSSGEVRVYFDRPEAEVERAMVRLLDISGRVLYAEEIILEDNLLFREEVIDFREVVDDGIYFLNLVLGNRSAARKIIIRK